MRIKTEIPIRADEICALFGCASLGNREISYITTDSREAVAGDLFVSLCENESESANHISDARRRGALTLGRNADIRVANPRQALLSLAAMYKKKLSHLRHTVMITGSVGKTTTKEILYLIVSGRLITHKSIGNFNNDIGLPLTILSAPRECELLILEAGMNHTGEISALSRCAEPDVSVITAIGTAHIGNLGSREAIARAKLEVLDGMKDGVLLCDADEPLLADAKLRITFSARTRGSDYSLLPSGRGGDSRFVFYTPEGREAEIRILCPVEHIATDVAAAASAAHILGIPEEEIEAALSCLDESILRHKLIKTDKLLILDDSYNSSFESIRASIDLCHSYGYHHPTALLSDILELGEHAKDIHEEVGYYVARHGVLRLYLCGEYAEDMKRGAILGGMPENEVHIFERTDNLSDIAKFIIKSSTDGELLLIKGSHATEIHKIIDHFIGG